MDDICDDLLVMGLDEICWKASEDFYEDCMMVINAGHCMNFKQDLNAECNCYRKFKDVEDCWSNC